MSRMGRPPKAPLTHEELAWVDELRRKGYGWRRAAREISVARGADVLDTRLAKQRAVSGRWLARAMQGRGKSAAAAKVAPPSDTDPPRQNAADREEREAETHQEARA